MNPERGPYGTMTELPDGTFAVRFERHLKHAPERVWSALTDPEEARHWFVEMTMEPRAGGSLRFDFGDDGETHGEVLSWDPPRLLEHSWTEAGNQSHVRWELTAAGDGTLLTLVHTRLVASPHEYGAGWHDFLDRLPVYLDGDSMPDFGAGFDALLEEYRVRV